MKKNIIILFFVICILQCSICPYASDNMTILTTYNAGEASVTVSGVSYGKTVVTVMPYGMTVDDLQDTDVPSYFMRMFVSGGNYKCVIGIPEDAPGGRYTILVSSASGKAESQFIHVNSNEALYIVQLINDAYNDSESVKNIVEENALSLGIDDTDTVFKNNIEQIAKMLASKVYNDVAAFHDAYSLIHSIV
ncbi:MAG: hypothetical protein SOW78_09640, partial [Clostridia bacterium]|nr:hypothetical protein [Clostridia bacterium]